MDVEAVGMADKTESQPSSPSSLVVELDDSTDTFAHLITQGSAPADGSVTPSSPDTPPTVAMAPLQPVSAAPQSIMKQADRERSKPGSGNERKKRVRIEEESSNDDARAPSEDDEGLPSENQLNDLDRMQPALEDSSTASFGSSALLDMQPTRVSSAREQTPPAAPAGARISAKDRIAIRSLDRDPASTAAAPRADRTGTAAKAVPTPKSEETPMEDDVGSKVTWRVAVHEIIEDFRAWDPDKRASQLNVFTNISETRAIEDALQHMVRERRGCVSQISAEEVAREWYRGLYHAQENDELDFRIKAILKPGDERLLGNDWTSFEMDVLKYLTSFTPVVPGHEKFEFPEEEEVAVLKDEDEGPSRNANEWLQRRLTVDRRRVHETVAAARSHARQSRRLSGTEQSQDHWYLRSPSPTTTTTTSSTNRNHRPGPDDRATSLHATTAALKASGSGSSGTSRDAAQAIAQLGLLQSSLKPIHHSGEQNSSSEKEEKKVRFNLSEEQLATELTRQEDEDGVVLTLEQRTDLLNRSRLRKEQEEEVKEEEAEESNNRRITFSNKVVLLGEIRRLPSRWPNMSRVHDKPPPRHLTVELLEDAAQEQGPKGEEALIVLVEGFDMEQVRELRIDYKNIFSVDNLWRTPHLTRLQLSNNVIEKMEGFDTLVHLEFLDLSFNNIKEVEGLEKNLKLTELALAHNMIAKPSNLLHLASLQILTFSHNCIKNPEDVLYFRRIKSLRSLTIDCNPCGAETAVAAMCISHIPQLIYLNFRYISRSMRDEAGEGNRVSLEAIVEYENGEKRVAAENAEIQERLTLLKSAYLNGLDEDDFFEYLFSKDGETDKIIHEIDLLGKGKERLRSSLRKSMSYMVKVGLEQKTERDAGKGMFVQCLDEAIAENVTLGRQQCDEFDDAKDEIMNDDVLDSSLMLSRLQDLSKKLSALEQNLLTAEIRLADQIEEVMKEFERFYTEKVTQSVEAMQRGFSTCRDVLRDYCEEASSDLQEFIDAAQTEQPPVTPVSDQLKSLLVDKQSFLALLSAANDTHLLLIDTKEDKLLSRLRGDAKELVKDLQDREVRRNLNKVSEVRRYISTTRKMISDEEEIENEYARGKSHDGSEADVEED